MILDKDFYIDTIDHPIAYVMPESKAQSLLNAYLKVDCMETENSSHILKDALMTQGSQREKWLRNVLENLQKSANLWEKFLVSTSLLSLPLSLLRSLKNLCFLILRFCFKLLVFLKTNQKNMVQK